MKFTIFTPLFNRKKLILKLYESIVNQRSNSFEWIIVYDGSTDNAVEVVDELIARNEIDIKYFYKNNGGKHSAINYGVSKAIGELFIMIDSDDIFAENAIQTIEKEWEAVKDKKDICGIVGLSSYTNQKIVGSFFPLDIWDVSFTDIYYKYGLKGDKSVAFKTEIMKEYPFPEKEGIRFVFEAVVWHDMAKNYKVRCLNKIIQYVEYQTNGLSDSSYKEWYIKSLAFSYFKLIEKNIHPINKYPKVFFGDYIYFIIYSLLSKEKYFKQLKHFNQKIIAILVFPRAYWSYRKMKKLIKE
jgi:glycosyltransferase involved in cell wall biosynthesis